MANESVKESGRKEEPGGSQIQPPAISLPKGGGAIRGIGEKFTANPVTGTGSMTVPIATSPGRSGFGPQLSLSYDSGAGNGPFGLGWNLSLPSITRKTDKGLPQYRDAEESDVFILSGAEDLVAVLVEKDGNWEREGLPPRTVDGKQYDVRRYRPRIEGLFARIERWTNRSDPKDSFWRSISRDNITTLYGKTGESRIADPADETRIFSWLICQSYDDKGNAIVYEYAPEDSRGIDLSQVHERNRTEESRSANRYLKRIKYGNRKPNRNDLWETTDPADLKDWMFEVVFDYGEGHCEELPLDPSRDEAEQHRYVLAAASPGRPWPVRSDPFSTYRAGFEVRLYRVVRRVLTIHHFPEELGIADCLVRSTDFSYRESPVASFITGVTQCGYKREPDAAHENRYLKKSLPPLEFGYSEVPTPEELARQPILEPDAESLANLPSGIDASTCQWVDLDGEGLSGLLMIQADAWRYKPNLGGGRFGPLETVALMPSLAVSSQGYQLLDVAGDGQMDAVFWGGPVSGLFERTAERGWETFRPFPSLPNIDWNDPNLRFVDLTGDGHADVLITENEVFTWYPSLAEEGFCAGERVWKAVDEEKGPKVVFADGDQSIYLADISGDGLSDLVRIRNGEVCYWPNLGYGCFGPRVTMDNAPCFDFPDRFDQGRIRLADTDGSGTTDILYLGAEGVRIYFNQSGNRWSDAVPLPQFPAVDQFGSVQVMDLQGNGTACLVWSTPLPGDASRPMHYIDLMGGQKPHLLVRSSNNLGAETVVHYAPSTKFYLEDKAAGRPWITRLPFPVHVVEKVETYDYISRNRFVTRYAYHHGHFDGIEREFSGFGMVEQRDTEEFKALGASDAFPAGDNIDEASHVPPVVTRTWFHTGVYLGRDHVSDFFAGLLNPQDRGEYYREPAWRDDDDEARKHLLEDTLLSDGLTVAEEREACRALKGAMLRQEVYALDGTGTQEYPLGHPYTVTEQNFAIRPLQPRAGNRHAVFLSHPAETLAYHYERNPADPRISHTLTMEVDDFGNVLKSAAIGYGRRQADPDLALEADRKKQTTALCTYTEYGFTEPIEEADAYRTPLPFETSTYELTGYTPTGPAGRFRSADFVESGSHGLVHIFAREINYEEQPGSGRERRPVEQVRTLYRSNLLTALLPLSKVESLALPGEGYKLAFTPGLLAGVYKRKDAAGSEEDLLPDPASVLRAEGGYILGDDYRTAGFFPTSDPDGRWWIPSGRIFFSRDGADDAAAELVHARQHFFLPHRYRDPFHTSVVSTETIVTYDAYDMLMVETRDPLGNTVTVGERNEAGDVTRSGNDYRVLQPRLVMDPNRNRAAVAFDTLGSVVGTAVMGKREEHLGDSLEGFDAELTESVILEHLANPLVDPHAILHGATTRLIYDFFQYQRTRNDPSPQPAVVYTMVRETHTADLEPGQETKIQHSFSYPDGFGREIQKKIQAEPGPLIEGGPDVSPRWVGSGWTIFNNKNKPIRQYEPFFSLTNGFEFANIVGVSPILFYDPVERVVATLHPNHTYEKVVFDPWRQTTWDVNDTVTLDPRADDKVKGYFVRPDGTARLPEEDYLPTWHALRTNPAHAAEAGLRWPDPRTLNAEKQAADKAEKHATTPTVTYFDTMGRPFLTLAHNGPDSDGTPILFPTRISLDIEGNQREVRDAIVQNGDEQGRMVMRYDYDTLGNRIHLASMEAGERWMLNDATGKPIRSWDSRGHQFRAAYDALRRPTDSFLREGTGTEKPVGRTDYGETHPDPEAANLRGRVVHVFDQVGTLLSEAYDFKGNLLRSARQLAVEYKNVLDWSGIVPLEEQVYTSHTAYDALNRPKTLRTPDNSTIRPAYNEANLLERMEANLRGAQADGQPVWTPFVADIDYDVKGRRTLIDYGNGARTIYQYDPLTFRLIHLLTRRDAVVFPDDCRAPSDPKWPGCQVQNLHYTYDPAGNITRIRDDAQQAVYFLNKRVEPNAEYTYDALYRLIEATGREHLGQTGGHPNPPTPSDALNSFHTRHDHPGDGKAMGIYVEQYVYDAMGNFLSMQHRGSDPEHAGWTRTYAYNETSQTESAKQSNRLSSTTLAGVSPPTEAYSYDVHGNMSSMPHLPLMQWDYRDQLHATSRQVVTGGGTAEITYYVYDTSGQRVRKITERSVGAVGAALGGTPTRLKERIYMGGFEIYREYESDGTTITLERETLHVMDDKQRIALVETRTQGTDPAPAQLIRYHFGNHLGSASLELDDQAQIISYEEYYPYGSTSYQAVRSQSETPKRYRGSAKELDEENGFIYHGARYYTPWLGRWISCDPAGVTDGMNLFVYVSTNPVRFSDPNGRAKFEHRPGYLFAQDMAHYNTEVAKEAMRAARGTPEFAEAKARFAAAVDAEFEVNESAQTQAVVSSIVLNTTLRANPVGIVYTAGEAGVGLGEAITGDEIKSLNPASPDFGKTTAMSGMTRIQRVGEFGATLLLPGLIKKFRASRAEASTAKQPVVEIKKWKVGGELAGITEEEIEQAVSTPGASNVMVQAPITKIFKPAERVGDVLAKPAETVERLRTSTKPYGSGGQYTDFKFDAKTSIPGVKGNVKTTMKIHDADPTAPAGGNSRTGTTLGIEQGKGNRRVVPDASSPWGGRWVDKDTATADEWNAAHMPIFR